MRRLLFELDFYWESPDGGRWANRPRNLAPEQYQLITYWRPRWAWLQSLLHRERPYER